MLGSCIKLAPSPGVFGDDVPIKLGAGGPASILWETADANANALIFVAPEGGATDVPAFIFGDASILNTDLTWFNGLTEPSLVVVNDAGDAYVRQDAGDDAVAGSKGSYYKAAADEDIELLNLSVTGTPRFYWDESEDSFRTTHKYFFDAGTNLGSGGAHKIEETLSADHTWSGFTCDGTAGAALAFPNLCYLGSDGKWELIDADAAATMPGLAIASATIVEDASGVFILPGTYVRDDTWNWTPGGLLYASTTAGGLTQTAPSGSSDVIQVVGFALTADIIYFNPSSVTVEVA